MLSFTNYIKALKSSSISFVSLVELLDDTESTSEPIWLDVLESSGSIKISFQNGVRRTVSITLDNSLGKYDIDINRLWIYQKFKVSTGIEYIDNNGNIDTIMFPQGVFYITNPQNIYNPDARTITFEGIDKWCRLNGKLGGKLEATYSFPKNYTDSSGKSISCEYNMFDIIKNLLKSSLRSDIRNIAFIPSINESDTLNSITTQINRFLSYNGFDLAYIKFKEAVTDNSNGNIYYCNNQPNKNQYPVWEKFIVDKNRVIDVVEPMLSNWFVSNDALGYLRIYAPYSITKKMDSNIEDILFEISTILNGNIYYDRVGRLILEPTQNQIADKDKEIVWDFSEDDEVMYSFESTYNFEEIYNQVVAQGTITDIGTYTVAVQNQDPKSPVSIDRIGAKTIIYDDLGVYDYKYFMEKKKISEDEAILYVKNNLREYAKWLLKKHTSLFHTATIECMPLPHLDVNQVVTVTLSNGTTNKYLITGIEMPLNPTESMRIDVVSTYDANIQIV